jgi:hypothetical protein
MERRLAHNSKQQQKHMHTYAYLIYIHTHTYISVADAAHPSRAFEGFLACKQLFNSIDIVLSAYCKIYTKPERNEFM